MTYKFRPAKREQCSLLIGLAGASSSGKTYSALRLATGLANGQPIAMIDTEARRGLHYADKFSFLHADLTAPFTPENYIKAIQDAKKAGAAVIIVDSQSHEHEGPGGILEQHDTELQRMAGDDYQKRERMKFAAWIKPKRSHNLFVNTVLQVEAHLIFCFRAKDKLKLIKNDKGKMEPVNIGWQPICSDRFEYEMTAMMVLPPGSEGRPDFNESATKTQDQFKDIFKPGQQITEDMGAALGHWAAGDTPPGAKGNGKDRDLQAEAKAAADYGMTSLKGFWDGLSNNEKRALLPYMDVLKEAANKSDHSGGLDGGEASDGPPDYDPFAEDQTEEAPDAPEPPAGDEQISPGHRQYVDSMSAELQDCRTPEQVEEILRNEEASGNWGHIPDAVQRQIAALASARVEELVGG